MHFAIDIKNLPAWAIADFVNEQLEQNGCVVVTAPPGAGKSTLLPLTIQDARGEKVLVLEPRRVAARQIAMRMATIVGETAGEKVGYRVRFENCVLEKTKVEVLTEGILTRMLLEDPTLEGVSTVVFDEFHERSLHADVALTLCREVQQLLRPDLKIVIMSATIDAAAICQVLRAPLVECEGRMFPVRIQRADEDFSPSEIPEAVAQCVIKAHREHEGDILVFLPGQADILRCRDLLADRLGDTRIFVLYGQLTAKEQSMAFMPSGNGQRKVVLATNIAETSLTIEGVRIVVDSGYCRKLVFDSRNGLSHLETVRISKDMAYQRSGRAGRLSSGICYRLWTLATEHRMPVTRTAEIQDADLSAMLLDVAAWLGNARVDEVLKMNWLDLPPKAMLYQAVHLLTVLGALDEDGKLTMLGKRLSKFPCHPRIALMLLKASSDEADNSYSDADKALAADIAAILEEKDPLSQSGSQLVDNSFGADLNARVSMLREARSRKALRQWERIERVAMQYRRLVGVKEDNAYVDGNRVGQLLACAYPERIALRQKDGSYLLAGGNRAVLNVNDNLSGNEWLVVASMNAAGNGRIFLASPVCVEDLSAYWRRVDNVQWDSKQGRVVSQQEWRIGKLVVQTKPLPEVPVERMTEIICQAAVKEGLTMFDFNEKVRDLQVRVATVQGWHPELELPSLETEAVLERSAEWLPYYIGKASSVAELRKIDLCEAMWSLLTYEQQQAVERLVPTHLLVPTGSRIRLEYRQGAELPVLRVRLQECFGLTETPRVDDGNKLVLMELLSPGFKPVQLTTDLASFWHSTYFDVRKELKRRYPKHCWPNNPLEATPTRGVAHPKRM